MADPKVALDLTLQIAEFKKNLKAIEDQTAQFSQDFQKNTKGNSQAWNSFVGNIAAKGVEVALSAVKNLAASLGNLGVEAVKNAAQLQSMSLELGTLLGSAEAGEKQLRSLQAFAGSSPFELPGIVNANKLLLGFGASAEEVANLLPVLGNIAAGSGKPIEELARIYGQVAAETKLSTERLNQLNDAGIALGPTLANKLGVPLANIRKLAQEGKISFADFDAALREIQSNGGTYFKAMETQAGSLNGRLSNLNDTIFNLSGAFGKALLPAVGQVVEYMIKFLESINVEEVVAWGQALGVVALAVGGIVIAMNAGTIAFAAFNAIMAATPYGLIALGIAGLIYTVKEIIQNWNEFKVAIVTGVEAILETLQPLAAAFDKLTGTNISGKIDSGLKALRETTLAISKEIEADAVAHQDKLAGITVEGEAKKATLLEQSAQAALDKQKAINAQRLADKQEADLQIALSEQEAQIQLAAIKAESEAISDSLISERAEVVIARRAEELAAQQAFEQSKLQSTFDAEQAKLQLIQDAVERENKIIEQKNKFAVDKAKLNAKQEVDSAKASLEAKKSTRQQELADQQQFFSAASSLASSENKKLAMIGKAAAIAEIAMKTPQAIASSFAFGTRTGGPILGAVFGTIAGVAMAAQAAKIAGMNFAQGGIVPGTSYAGDRVAANVNSGEMILNKQQQSSLFNLANGGNVNNDAILDRLMSLEAAILSQPIQVMVGDNEIAMATYRGRKNGVPV